MLIDWINDVLVGERIIVKDLAEDLYDGQVLQKLFGEDQFISFRFKVRFVHFMPSTGCLVNYSCNEILTSFLLTTKRRDYFLFLSEKGRVDQNFKTRKYEEF